MQRYAVATDRPPWPVKAVSGAEADVTTTAGQLLPAIKASGAILDPEIVLEDIAFSDDPRVVVHDTRFDLFGGQVVLLFSGSRFIPLTIPEDIVELAAGTPGSVGQRLAERPGRGNGAAAPAPD